MIHGLCGFLNFISLCMVKKYPNDPLICTKRFPREFNETIIVNADGYFIYRRRRMVDDEVIIWGFNNRFDNRWVVLYNPFLTRLFKIYINVEVYITVKIVKYICKYIYKGHDKVTLQIYEINEITRYVICRYISPAQAIWSILEFLINKKWPTI